MASWPPPSHHKMQLQAGGYNLIISDPISVNSILIKTTVSVASESVASESVASESVNRYISKFYVKGPWAYKMLGQILQCLENGQLL